MRNAYIMPDQRCVRSIADTPKLCVVPHQTYEYNKSNSGDVMSVPSKVRDIRLVEIQFYDWLATTTGGNRLVGVRCDAMGIDPHMEVGRVSVHNSRGVEGVLPKNREREKTRSGVL